MVQEENNNREHTDEHKKESSFPLGDFLLFIGSAIAVGSITVWYESFDNAMESEGLLLAMLFSALFITIIATISAGFQFLLTRYPAGWIAKQKHMYSRDMWQAIFYSSMIVLWLGLVTEPLEVVSQTTHSTLSNVISTIAFLLFYFNGKKKESKVKRAVLIVSVVWLILSLLTVYIAGNVTEPAI